MNTARLQVFGSLRGEPGVGISSIEQTTRSTENGDVNVLTITLDNGHEYEAIIQNGEPGKSAYLYAKEAGYEGTEETFAAKLAEDTPTKEEFNKLSDNKLDKAKLPEAINIALTQAKESEEFKGDKGDKGDTGEDGQDGADGRTPEKGVDYFTEADKTELVASVLNALPTWNGGAY